MIFVFGSILQLIRVEADKEQQFKQFEFTKFYKNSVCGKGALQAVAAAKAGAKTAIASKTGDDELAKHILLRLRKHGVITSAVAKTAKAQTGTAIRLEHENRTIIALGASIRATADQIPVEAMNDRSIILIQTEFKLEENAKLIETAKEVGAKVVLNASPRFDPSINMEHIDYLIMGLHNKEKWEKVDDKPKALITIFISPKGNIEINMKGETSPIPKITSEELTWSNPEGYEDTFCGTFAAELYAQKPLDQAILRAHIGSALTASKPGAYDAIPYVDSIDEHIKALNNKEE